MTEIELCPERSSPQIFLRAFFCAELIDLLEKPDDLMRSGIGQLNVNLAVFDFDGE